MASACARLSFALCVASASAAHFRSDVLLQINGSDDLQKQQWVHWVFVTDCSAYMFNQGNVMLASAHHVNQPGEFTWIAYGCDRDEQKKQFKRLAHPRAKVWHVKEQKLIHPLTGKEYRHFQASNRPLAILDWWKNARPKEEAIGILDPDETWMRAVHFVAHPRDSSESGPWETNAAKPKMASAAEYGIGCVFGRVHRALKNMCGGNEECMSKAESSDCYSSYSSGPPWVLHRSDADDVYGDWVGNAILMHEAWPDLLAEQGSYGITQAKHNVKSHLDAYWFLSAPGGEQPWSSLLAVPYDPCLTRAPPDANFALPPLWHACSTWEIPHLQNSGFRLHKDHIHKDLLECSAPLLHYPPRDALTHYYTKDSEVAGRMQSSDMEGFKSTWSVCTYTNLVNHYARSYKNQYCEEPNLEANFTYPPHSQGFLLEGGHIERVFRKGGWSDVDYKVGSLAQIGARVFKRVREALSL